MATEHGANYDEALAVVRSLAAGEHVGVSLLQRKLKLGYNRAAYIMEELEEAGIVSVPDIRGQRQYIETLPLSSSVDSVPSVVKEKNSDEVQDV